MIKRTTIIEVVTFLDVVLFLYTGIAKIMDYSVFKAQLEESPILGFSAKLVSIFLPVLELIIVLLLVIPRWRLKGLIFSLSLMVAFTAYIIAMFVISPEMPCSCGGLISQLSWKQHVLFNVSFILFNLTALILQIKNERRIASNYVITS